ncbi:hypothetical protein B296_00022308 [Ensete ventricosum]|uniref:Uncharacterized protein n=1 Tax=Ensete ventricosum TaxID=4639 RepID=A0A427AMR5_ENSVE|nr:hypothetical protein B296_00022308 [Ensete ventricosum]
MTSSDSSSSVRVVSSLGLGEASRCDPEVGSSGASSEPPSLADARVLRDLEVMKADHDLDTVVTKGSLAVIRERYSIPAEYGLHIGGSGLTNRMDLGELRGMPKVSDGKAPPTRPVAQEIGASPMREAPKASSKRPVDAPTEQTNDPARRHKKVKVLTMRHKSRHGERESHSRSKGKEPTAPSEEPNTPAESEEGGASPVHHRLRSMKDLFKTKVHNDDTGYYTLQMSDLGHQDPDKEIKAIWRGLKNSTKVWNDSSAAKEFERGLLHTQLARELYTLPRRSYWPELPRKWFCYYFVQSQHFQMALFDRVHDAGRLITFMDYRISQLQQELDALKSSGGPKAVAKAEERASELQKKLEKTTRERNEALLRHEASEKELNEVWSNLAEVQRLLKEA